MTEDIVLQVTELSKSFPGVQALDKVSLALKRGTVHAVCGENGAGKSTLMNILMGVDTLDSGEIRYKGEKVNFIYPKQALSAGISIIEQELTPISGMTVAENIFLGREPVRSGIFVNYSKLNHRARSILEELEVEINPSRKMKHLSLAEVQLVEIAKALSYDSEIIVMDEPTSALGEREVEKLFKIIRLLKDKGKSVIYVSHRMKEVFSIADEVTILRDGKYVATEKISEIDSDKLVELMLGRRIGELFNRETVRGAEKLLETRNFTKRGQFKNIDITLNRGEVLGIFGLMGSGRTEFLHALFGFERVDQGDIYIDNEKTKIRSPKKALRCGIALVSEDRKAEGLLLSCSVAVNITISALRKISIGVFLNGRKEKEKVAEMVRRFSVRTPNLNQLVRFLSGGNQQKVVLCKCLLTEPRILLMDEPTRGIDVGAKNEIYRFIADFAQRGCGVILVSSEIQEILSLSDRVLVFRKGMIVGEFKKGEATQEKLLHLAS